MANKKQATKPVPRYFSINIPSDVADELAAQAAEHGLATEQLLADRLIACKDHTAEIPLYANDAERQQLDSLLGYNFRKMSDVIARIQRLMSCIVVSGKDPGEIEPLSILLSLQRIERIKGQCHHGTLFNDRLRSIIERSIDLELGLL